MLDHAENPSCALAAIAGISAALMAKALEATSPVIGFSLLKFTMILLLPMGDSLNWFARLQTISKQSQCQEVIRRVQI